ncbi:MAG: carbonic anhydrase [Verrucomicrobiaceae bacterium]|nr:carbonic anhydrase [Verrucomicrobiaceae bacterium]
MKYTLSCAVLSLLALTQCSSPVQTKESQSVTSPSQAVQGLMTGNQRFASGHSKWRNLPAQVKDTAKGQHPIAAIVSCMDSRTSSELVFDQGIGDIFNIRIAGNVINNDILGSLEYACDKAGAKAILVVGHTSCGAIHGAIAGVKLGHLTGLLDKIKPAINQTPKSPDHDRYENSVTITNVRLGLKQIRQQSETLRKLESQGKITIQGAIYHIDTGRVELVTP